MTSIFNRNQVKPRRRILRRNFPQPERLLWEKLRNRQLANQKFKRQYSIGPYIADFYCPAAKLVIEIDGDSHFNDAAEEYDRVREQYMQSVDLTTMRFTNQDIMKNLEGVLEVISKTLQ